MAAYRCSFN